MNNNYNELWKELKEKIEKGVDVLNHLNESKNHDESIRIKGKIEGLNLVLSYMVDFEKIFINENNDLNEIQEKIEELKNDGRVKVINGMFKGFLGTITDIDELDTEKPLIIQLDDNEEFEGAIIYLNRDDVELLKNNKE